MATLYKQLVSNHLQSLVDDGHTHLEIARKLGFRSGNIVTMHLNPEDPIAPMPLARLPALAEACDLSSYECSQLAFQRARDYPAGATAMNVATYAWLLRHGCAAARVVKARRARVGGAHAC